MKKQLLFVIDSLHCAGAEKSLVTLLSLLDYKKYDVDLLLFAHGTTLESLVPANVTILKPFRYTHFANLPLSKAVVHTLTHGTIGMLAGRLRYSYAIRREAYWDENIQKARIYWQHCAPLIDAQEKEYDVAISYAQGIPTFYVAEKVKAKKKLAWVNVSYKLNDSEKAFQRPRYEAFDTIVAVSHSTKEIFQTTFPDLHDRIEIMYDINHPELIQQMSTMEGGYQDEYDGLRFLTIGRLSGQKGYDIALDACRRLKESGLDFRWYVLGKGPDEAQISEVIERDGLQQHFILLGVEANPYPYIAQADLYIQTSKFEGFGLAIAEARMLNIPVVTTRFDAVFNQMVHGKNGLVVDMNGEAVMQGVQQLLDDSTLRSNIVQYLQKEKKGNVEELQTFYALIS